MKNKRLYIIYDGRAVDSTEDASVMVTCDSLKEARSYRGDFGDGCAVWSYATKKVRGKKAGELYDEKFEEIL